MSDMVAVHDLSPVRMTDMLSHMSKENSNIVGRLIIALYNGDKSAQQYEEQKKRKKEEAFEKLEKLRKEYEGTFGNDFDPDKELIAGLEAKYGSFN